MLTFKQILTHTSAAAVGVVAALTWMESQPQPAASIATTQQDTAVTESVTTVTKKPDGNVVIEKKTRKVEEKRAQETAITPVVPPKPDYSVGISAYMRSSDERPELGISVGKRLFGDVWGEIGTTEKLDYITIGIRAEF